MLNTKKSNWLRKRTWAEVDLDNLAHNINITRQIIGEHTKLMAAVKADAYGHGDKCVVQQMQSLGVDAFGVSDLVEAVSLRESGITKEILVFSPIAPDFLEDADMWNIITTIPNFEYAILMNEKGKKLGKKLVAHIKVDTGMNRLGFQTDKDQIENSIEKIAEVYTFENIEVAGIYSHFANADSTEPELISHKENQFEVFKYVLDSLVEKGVELGTKHCCNSASALCDPDYHLDLVRIGNLLYGNLPGKRCQGMADFKPIMSLKTKITNVKTIKPGESVSYVSTFTANKTTKVATVGIGYADGYHRVLSNKIHMIVNGQKAKIIGNICMDQTMIDVTGIDCEYGDTVTVVGTDGEMSVTWDDLACAADTINYEMTCGLSRRVPKIFLKDKKDIDAISYIDERSSRYSARETI